MDNGVRGKRWAILALATVTFGTYLLVGGPQTSAGASACSLGDVQISIVSFAFNPTPKSVQPGTKVCWTNNASIDHTTTSDTSIWDSMPLSPNGQYEVTFPTPGTFAYHCSIHTFMHGTIVVPPAAPIITSTTPASPNNDTNPTINGTSDNNLTIHVYSGSACATQIGTTTANGTGGWSFPLPEPDSITSGDTEAFTAKEAAASDGTLSGCSNAFSYTADTTGPDITFDAGPADTALIVDSTPTWTFHSMFAGAAFKCSVQHSGPLFTDCTSPFTASTLGAGAWTFALKAYDPANTTDERIVMRSFTLDLADPVIHGPAKTRSRQPKFTLTGNAGIASYECKFDGGLFTAAVQVNPTTSTCQPAGRLRVALHTLTAHAIDSTTGDSPGPDKVKHFRIIS